MTSLLIRPERDTDASALARLAALDSRRLPAGDLLVAEVDGELVAALSLATGEHVADPFRRTADAVALLTLRASRLRAAAAPRRRRLRLRPAARTA